MTGFYHDVALLANLRERLLWIVLADSRIGRFFSFGGNLSSFRASMLLRNEWKCTWSDFFRALPFVLKQPIRIVLHAWPAWEQKIMKRLSASSRSRSLCVREIFFALMYQQRRNWFTIIGTHSLVLLRVTLFNPRFVSYRLYVLNVTGV